MKLNFRRSGDGEPLIILHGLFGSLDNWQTISKKFAENFTVYLVDQRNHGHSPHSDEMNYFAMADDLAELMESENISKANLLGHSMGGKTILFFAQNYAEKIKKMIVADMGMKRYPPHHDVIFNALLSADLEKLKTRKEVEDHVEQYISDPAVVAFLLKNLYWKEKDQLAWRMNLQVLYREIDEILTSVPDKEITSPTLFIRGGKSNYITDDDMEKIRQQVPQAAFVTIEKAGHWIHAEAPREFYEAVMNFLR